jgi:hypothetical protein
MRSKHRFSEQARLSEKHNNCPPDPARLSAQHSSELAETNSRTWHMTSIRGGAPIRQELGVKRKLNT